MLRAGPAFRGASQDTSPRPPPDRPPAAHLPPTVRPPQATAAYVGNEINFIREVCRLDPPVTSATTSLKEDREVLLYNNVGFNRCNGNKTTFFRKGSLQQYTLSMANRDANQFTDPAAFDPTRDNVEEATPYARSSLLPNSTFLPQPFALPFRSLFPFVRSSTPRAATSKRQPFIL